MRAFIIVAAIFFVPGFIWYICIRVAAHQQKRKHTYKPKSDIVHTYGYVGFGSNIKARKHNVSGFIEYKFYELDVWRTAGGLAETFRTEKQFE